MASSIAANSSAYGPYRASSARSAASSSDPMRSVTGTPNRRSSSRVTGEVGAWAGMLRVSGAVEARRRSAPDDVAPAAVADETHGTLVPVDLRGHRGEPVIHGDVGRLGGGSADAGKGERDGRMARLAERGEHGIPRRRRQPEPGNENDLHGPTVVRAPDTEKTPVTGEPPGTETPHEGRWQRPGQGSRGMS